MMESLRKDINWENDLSHVQGLPRSESTTFNLDDLGDFRWARAMGLKVCNDRPEHVEAATFIDLGEQCWIIGVKGAVHLHSDRNMLDEDPELGGHVWNAVIEADGDQMLLVRETHEAYRHFRLAAGEMIYFNTYQPHLISRTDAFDRCVMLQVAGIGPDEPERAFAAMVQAVARQGLKSQDKAA